MLAGENLNRDNYGLTVNHTWVVNPNVIITFNANATAYKTTDGSPAASVDPIQYGFSDDFANSQPLRGLPQLQNVLGLSKIGTTVGPLYENDYQWEGRGFVTQIVGRHTLRYGAEYLLQQEAEGNNSGATGIFNFTSIWTSPNPNTTAPPGGGYGKPVFPAGPAKLGVHRAERDRILVAALHGRFPPGRLARDSKPFAGPGNSLGHPG